MNRAYQLPWRMEGVAARMINLGRIIMKTRTVALVCGVFSVAFSDLCPADIEPVSVADPLLAASASANGFSAASEISPDGRYVLFGSLASNLATNDYNYCADVFLRDRQTGTTLLISANPDGFSGNGTSSSPSLSTNAGWVAFQSDATDLAADDANGATDIFVRNLALGQTALVSVNTNGVSGNQASTSPIMTADGRFVAFESLATDLVTNYDVGKGVRFANVYLRDLANNSTVLASVGTNGYSGTYSDSQLSGVSADGRYVLFVSIAKNIGVSTNTGNEIFLRDIQAGQTYWISTNVATLTQRLVSSGPAVCFNPVMSGDGQSLAFRVTKNPWSLVLRHDLASKVTQVISSNNFAASVYNWDYAGPSISDDGGVVAFMEAAKTAISSTSTNQIYVWDTANKTNILVTLAPDGITPGNASSDSPVLSADGRALSFLSVATNLVAKTPAEDHGRVFIRNLATGTTKLVSLETNLEQPMGDVFEYPIVSADGHFVVFSSSSDGLVNNDHNGEEDVFLGDSQTGMTELVSSKSPTIESLTADDSSFIPANGLSGNGRFAVFSSLADNLATRDTNLCNDIFVRDMATGKSLLVSMNIDGSGTGNGNSTQPSISAEGRLVAFQSDGSDLVPGDTNNAMDVFVHDLATRETRLVSVRKDGAGSASGVSDSPAITPDGRFVIFRSISKNLTTNLFSDSNFKLYAYDTETGTNRLLSLNNSANVPSTLLAIAANSQYAASLESSGTPALYLNNLSTQGREAVTNSSGLLNTQAAFSGDGKWLAYLLTVTGPGNKLILYDVAAKTNIVINVNIKAWSMSLSGDGSRVAYESLGTASNLTNKHQIFVFDAVQGSNILVSANIAGDNGGNGDSRNPIISPDGRYVYFNSQATDLVQDTDQNDRTDVFVRDLNVGTTRLLSVNRFKTGSGNSQSNLKALSADGQVVAMQSFASDLMPADLNMSKDVFVLRANASLEDADNDGLPDGWEMEKFGSLERDGTGDFDGDGVSDGAEYLAGTAPTDKQSVLRVTEVENTVTGRRITWTAIPGKTYQIQFKTDLHDVAWENLEGTVKAEAATGSKADETSDGAEQRFYRVLLVP